jgi:hypothetical protein
MKHLVESFDSFMQQASIAQNGNSGWIGSNPKVKRKKTLKVKPKPKSKQPVK